MDRDSLIKARDATAARFEEVERTRASNVGELNRLQGVYQTYQQLIDQLDSGADKLPETGVVPKEIEVKHAEDSAK